MEVSSYRLVPVYGGTTHSHIFVHTKLDVLAVLRKQLLPAPNSSVALADRVHVYADDRKLGTYTPDMLHPSAPLPIDYVFDLDHAELGQRPLSRFGRRSKSFDRRLEVRKLIHAVATSEHILRPDEVEDVVDEVMRLTGSNR